VSREKFKARERFTQKMTRDGLIERNESTGGESRISKRDADFDIRRVKTDEATYSTLSEKISANTTRNRQKSSYQQFQHTQETEQQTSQYDRINHDTPQYRTSDTTPDISSFSSGSVREMENCNTPQVNHGRDYQTDPQPVTPYSPVRERQDRQIETPKGHENVNQRRYDEPYKQFHQEHVTEAQKPSFQHDVTIHEPYQSQLYTPTQNVLYNDIEQIVLTSPVPDDQHRGQSSQVSRLRHDEPVINTEPARHHSFETAVQIDSAFTPAIPVTDVRQEQPNSFSQTGLGQEVSAKKSKLRTQRESTYSHNKDYGLLQNKTETLKHSTQNVDTTVVSNANQSSKMTAEQADIIVSDAEQKINSLSEMTPDDKRKIRKASTYKHQKTNTASQTTQQSDTVKTPTPIPVKTDITSDISSDAPVSTQKSNKDGKLHFSDNETTPEKPKSREVIKAEHQFDKASGKLEKANKKLPSKRKLRSERVFDEKSGKAKRKLYFDKEVKPQGEHLKGAVPLRPVKAGLNAAIVYGHKKVFQVEHENVELKAAHRGEMIVEGGVRTALRHHKTAPYRQTAKLQHNAAKKQANLNHKKALEKTPKKKNFISRAWHKRTIKKNYAKQARTAQKTAKGATNIVQKAGALAMKAFKVIAMNPKVKIILLLCAFLLLLMLSMCSAMGGLGIGGVGGVTATTFLAADADMLGAEAVYAGMEAELQYFLDNYETLNPGYDEYIYDLDSIWHDPYVLISIISALHDGEWTLSEVQGTLTTLFERQYTLTETVTVEVRYRTETHTETITEILYDDDGEPYTHTYTISYEVEVPYDYYIITVILENFNLSHLPVYIMGEDRFTRYAQLMWTLGNRPDLFPTSLYPSASYPRDFERYEIPPDALSDPVFAAMIAEAEKYLGFPYVWGGSNPSTSFDCSGYVSWVINNTFWNVGRLGAKGLYNICTPISPANARPGDLVFFWRTYRAPDPNAATHVGIYVGNGMMIHCGNPISYASINTTYWQNHFFGFGRLP
jgi:cell wall-associated NlpC family hydrolase